MKEIYIILLLLNALYASILTIYKSTILQNTKTKYVLFMQYVSATVVLIIMYGGFLFFENSHSIKKEDLNEIFHYKNKNIWIYCIITSILGYISLYYYYQSLKHLGPSQTQIIYSISKIIFVFILSILILKNKILNIKTYLGIFLGLLSIYLLNENSNYI